MRPPRSIGVVRTLRVLLIGGLVPVGLIIAHLAHRQVDEARFRYGASTDRVAPHPPSIQLASMGQPTLLADLMWVRTVLAFAEVHGEPSAAGIEWLSAMVETVYTLDGRWRTAYFYGGSFLRVLGDIEGSDVVFEAGHAALPNDPFFPFSLGMNAYLYHHDSAAAHRWVAAAADLPGAPNWYQSAAAGFIEEGGGREAALRYLEEQRRTETRPQVRRALDAKYDALLHEELEEQIAAHRRRFVERFGRDITSVQELGSLPADPLGGAWVLAPDGVVRSSVREARLAAEAVNDERAMILLPLARRPL